MSPLKSAGKFYLILFVLAYSYHLPASDNVHFYQAGQFRGEPRLRHDELGTLQVWFGGGTTTVGFDKDQNKVGLFSIYNPINIREIAKGLPNAVATMATTLITDLWEKNPSQQFGNFTVDAEFTGLEWGFEYWQNFKHGFFLHTHLPGRSLQIKALRFIDQTPADIVLPTDITANAWLNFKANFQTNIEKYGVRLSPVDNSGCGDLSCLIGWSYSHQYTTIFDFIDTSIEFGFLLPTGSKKNLDRPFDLALGYDGFWGFPIAFDAACGLFEWLTLGTHIDAIFFIDSLRATRMMTDLAQRGPIKLAKSSANIEPGTVWNTNIFCKSDHLPCGLSWLVGYSYNKGEATILHPQDSFYDYEIVNSDEQLQDWSMHVINIMLEYDFTSLQQSYLPLLRFNFNLPFRGRRCFKTQKTSATLGLNFCWEY